MLLPVEGPVWFMWLQCAGGQSLRPCKLTESIWVLSGAGCGMAKNPAELTRAGGKVTEQRLLWRCFGLQQDVRQLPSPRLHLCSRNSESDEIFFKSWKR